MLFLLIRPRTSPAQWRNLSSIARASHAQTLRVTIGLIFTFRFSHLFPVTGRNLSIPINLIRLRIRTPFVGARRLPLCRFLIAIRLWRNFRFGTKRFLTRFHHNASFSLQI
jgi:hypothetical protein